MMDDKTRFRFLLLIFSLCALGVLGRYAYLMLINPPQEKGGSPVVDNRERGAIVDRNGRILALQTHLGNITAWRPELRDLPGVSASLAPILGMTAEEIRGKIEDSPTDFIYLKKQVDHSTVEEVQKLREAGSIRGIGVEAIKGRIYPEKELASQVIGFVGDNNQGLAGIEYAFNEELSQGDEVMVTLDSNVQFILEGIARRIMRENAAEAVMMLALEPRSGEILGSASLPGFDPNAFRESTEIERMDRPAIWAYEPGSVFKVFSMAALLDSGSIRPNSSFYCNGHYEHVSSRGERVVINCLSAHGPVTAREIIIYSCNAGAAYASDRLGNEAFYGLLKDFGFGLRTLSGNPGETAGFLRSWERWSDRSKPTIAMGQEIAVSALQMVQAATAVANDGILVSPRVVSRVSSASGHESWDFGGPPPRRVLEEGTARAMRSYMVDVTSGIGTGWRANVEDLSLAVKTGTAQIIDPATGAYSETDFIASCMALLPAENPSLILYLVIIKPQGESYLGGRIAAPPIREAAEALVNYLGIPRGRNPKARHSGEVRIPQARKAQIGKQMPNLSGFSKRELLPLLAREDIQVEIYGEGWVVRQSPAPGSPVEAGTQVILELE